MLKLTKIGAQAMKLALTAARAEALASALQARNWIAVADKLPEGSEEVIYDDGVEVGVFLPVTGDEPSNQAAARCERFGITYWMPMPLPYSATQPSPTLAQVREALEKCVGAIEAYMAPGDDITGVIARVVRVKELTEPALTAARDALALMGAEKV